ncbi:patatin-like protein 2 [Dorcoceras hygrometricum]|uniref:Patatin-like protein 2 n=1 Tax=Dorcoceras hygrometricum TaxID=472368 RepID=A0A2Z7A5Y3_9LAMI|nr:patatin-like protein 2 [Dorcoceras hygrometricum]
MASALISNILHISFDSVLAMDDAGLVAVFEALVATGAFQLSMDGLTDLSEVPKDLFFDARSIVSDSGEQVSTSCKRREMNIEFRLLSDILAKTIFVKAGSFDIVTHERFLLMTAIISGVKINLSRLLFDILKDMATPGSSQAKGFAIQICVLLKNVSGLELGDSKEFPSPRILTEKTVHRYVVINEKVFGEEVADIPRVKKTPKKKAVSIKRPAVVTGDEPAVKKKRTSKSKSVSSKENLDILPVAQEVVPLQIIEPTPVAPAEQPSVPKRKSKKRRLRLPRGSYDENVESVDVQRAETAVDIFEEETVSVFEESETTVANVPVAESAAEEVILTSADEVDVIIEQVIAETAQMGADEEKIDIGEEFHARQAEQPVVTASDTDEDIETIDVGTGVGDQKLQTFDTADSRTDASADYIVTELVEEMKMAAVAQSADEAMSLEDILMTILVECPFPSASGEITKITLDIEVLVQLWEQIIDDVDRFFNSFSLKKLAALQTEDISAKEELVLNWAEADSTKVALQRHHFTLTKYRELLLRKFLEALIEQVSSVGFRRQTVTFLGWYQICTVFARFCLFNGLSTVDIRNFVSSIAENRTALRDIQSVNRSVFVSQNVQFIVSSPVEDQSVQMLLDQRPFSSSSSDDSSMHFVEDDIQFGDDATSTEFSLPTAATDVPDAFAQLRASIDQLHFEQIRRKDDRVLLNNIRHDARDHKNLLSLDLKSSQQKLSSRVAAAAFDTVDVRKEVKELNAKVTFLDGQVAAIRSELFDFRSKAEENHLNLSTQLGFLVDYINRGGDAQNGQGGSSRPQPPPDDQSRPSGGSGVRGSRPNVQSRYGGGTVSRESSDRGRSGSGSERRRPDDISGNSKRKRSHIGESGVDSGLPPKRGYQWFIFGE